MGKLRFGSRQLVLAFAATGIGSASVLAHGDEEHCAAIARSVELAGFAGEVSVRCDAGYAILVSDTYPDHPMMTGIVATNEQVPVPAKDYAAPIPLVPQLGEDAQTRDAALGVAVNGVPIYDYTGGGEMSLDDLRHHQAEDDTILTQQLDICGGHAGRGDDYHYHAKPICMIEMMTNAGDDAIIGWAFDGFPIYGDSNPDGTAIEAGALDICNGQPDDTFGYRYHTSKRAPYIVQCLMGEVVDMQELPRVSPLQSPSSWLGGLWGGGRSAGKPPRGGVEGLVFDEDRQTGQRRMEYRYRGAGYFMRYRPADTPDCYLFETRTVTDDGEIETGEYCR